MADAIAELNRLGQVTEVANTLGIRPELLHSVVQQESGGNPNAKSPKGALGTMQVMPATAAQPGMGVKPFNPANPDENLRGGATYLKALLDKYGGDEQKALAAYNGGTGRVDRGGPLPAETQAYVPSVTNRAGAPVPAADPPDALAEFNALGQAPAPTMEPPPPPVDTSSAGPMARFAKGVWDTVNPMGIVDVAKAAYHDPLGVVRALYHQQADQFGKAKEDFQQGHYSEMLGHGVAGAVPLLGPAAAHAGEKIAAGDIAGGLGEGAGLLLGGELGKLVPGRVNPEVNGTFGKTLTAPIAAADAIGNKVLNSARSVPEGLMNAAHKFTSKERLANPDINLARVALDEGINPGKGGMAKASSTIKGIEQLKTDLFAKFGNQKMDFAQAALDALESKRQDVLRGIAPDDNIADIDGLIAQIKANPKFSKETFRTEMVPTPSKVAEKTPLGGTVMRDTMVDVPTKVPDGRVPIESDTNAVRGAMAEENANVRGRFGVNFGPSNTETAGRKLIRKVASDQLKTAYDPLAEAANAGVMGSVNKLLGRDQPTLSALQKRQGGVIALQKAAQRGEARVANHNPLSLTSMILGTGAGAMGLGPVGAGLGAIAGYLASKPVPLSMLARAINGPVELAGKTARLARKALPGAVAANSTTAH